MPMMCDWQGFCPHGQHNRMADMLFKTGEAALHEVLHAPLGQCQRVVCAEKKTTRVS